MALQSTSLMDTFENSNEAFKALTVSFVQKEVDYDYSINQNVLFNVSLIVSMLALKLSVNFGKQRELLISQSFSVSKERRSGLSVYISCTLLNLY